MGVSVNRFFWGWAFSASASRAETGALRDGGMLTGLAGACPTIACEGAAVTTVDAGVPGPDGYTTNGGPVGGAEGFQCIDIS